MCTYCANFVDTDFAEQFITATTPASTHSSFALFGNEDDDLVLGSDHHHAVSEHHHLVRMQGESEKALDVIAKEMVKNENIAQFEEIKVNTEMMLGVF